MALSQRVSGPSGRRATSISAVLRSTVGILNRTRQAPEHCSAIFTSMLPAAPNWPGVCEESAVVRRLAVTPGSTTSRVRVGAATTPRWSPTGWRCACFRTTVWSNPTAAGVMRRARNRHSRNWFATALLPIGDQDASTCRAPDAAHAALQADAAAPQVYDADGKMLGREGVYETRCSTSPGMSKILETLFVSMRGMG